MLWTLRTSRAAFARVARQQFIAQRRTFIRPTASLQADLVQDLYLKELKNYKPAAPKPNEADQHVKKFAVPAAPSNPEETNIAEGLEAYEQQQVEVEGQAAAGEAEAVEEDWFEPEPEEEGGPAH